MLKNRIIATLKFFDLQDYPLTLLELHRFLVADWEELRPVIDGQGENIKEAVTSADQAVPLDKLLMCLRVDCVREVQNDSGFYFLAGRRELAQNRMRNYFHGIFREKIIRRWAPALRFLPFVRGAALAGSQALGQQKPNSDIDLFIVVDPDFLWLARTLVTGYFQLLGRRRYGRKIANRFCLNHYVAGPKAIVELRNAYTASEYLKLRSLTGAHSIWQFQQNNAGWLKTFFPNADILEPENQKQPRMQKFFERLLDNRFGRNLNKLLKNWQLPKIREEKFIVVADDELSFHPESKQEWLLAAFLEFQKQQQRITEHLIV